MLCLLSGYFNNWDDRSSSAEYCTNMFTCPASLRKMWPCFQAIPLLPSHLSSAWCILKVHWTANARQLGNESLPNPPLPMALPFCTVSFIVGPAYSFVWPCFCYFPQDKTWCPKLGHQGNWSCGWRSLIQWPSPESRSSQSTGVSGLTYKLWWFQSSWPNLLHSWFPILWWHVSHWPISSLAFEFGHSYFILSKVFLV